MGGRKKVSAGDLERKDRMNWLRSLNGALAKIERFIISVSIIGMTIILLGNVAARSIFNNSWTFAEEVGQFFIIIVTFVGLSYCARQGRHLKMTAIVEFLPIKVRKGIVLLITSSTALLLFYLCYLSIDYVLTLYTLERVTPALRVPLYLIHLFIPLGFLFAGIQYLTELRLNIKHEEIIDGTADPDLKEKGAGEK